MSQTDLFSVETPKFSDQRREQGQPLAANMRPEQFENYFGHHDVFVRYPSLKSG